MTRSTSDADTGERRLDPESEPRPAVLIVDDVHANLVALEAMLRRDDIEIITASSGAAALEILLVRRVAVAIIDVQMPEMDGFELASLIHGVERTRNVPIIFVTAGSHDSARIARGYSTGAVDYLFKPIDELVLRGKVDVFVMLEKSRQRLEEADRMRETFIAVLGHDLRNPLGGMMMNAQLLQRCEDPGDATEHIQRIIHSGNRMSRMIEQLLDATRFRKDGRVSLVPTAADLHDLAGQIASEFEQSSDRVRLEVVGDTRGSWDTDRIEQVLSNLVGNAISHSPSGACVRVHVDGEQEDTVRVQIHNEGPPIPQHLRATLFEPFRRFELVPRKRQGLGLGLYITQQLVHAHGGVISFESSAESGTCFSVYLPRHVRPTQPSDSQLPQTESAADVGAPNDVEGATILLVEDNDVARMSLEELLQDSGYRVIASGCPENALALAKDHGGAIDVLLSDIRLPKLSGQQLAQQLRQARPDMRVVFMSGLSEAPTEDAAFIQKPLDLNVLIETLQNVLLPS